MSEISKTLSSIFEITMQNGVDAPVIMPNKTEVENSHLVKSCMSTFKQIIENELSERNISWCRSCDSYASHKRGFAYPSKREIHYDTEVATRATFLGMLHEIGHVEMGHGKVCKLRRFQKEAEATAWAFERMKHYGVSIPRNERAKYARYVSRMKRWGDNSIAGRR